MNNKEIINITAFKISEIREREGYEGCPERDYECAEQFVHQNKYQDLERFFLNECVVPHKKEYKSY